MTDPARRLKGKITRSSPKSPGAEAAASDGAFSREEGPSRAPTGRPAGPDATALYASAIGSPCWTVPSTRTAA